MSDEDPDLVKLRIGIADKATLTPDMHDVAELYSVLEFLGAKGIPAAALHGLLKSRMEEMNKSKNGPAALPHAETTWRGGVVGAVLWLVELKTKEKNKADGEVPESAKEKNKIVGEAPKPTKEENRIVGEARRAVAKAARVPFENVKSWHQNANQTGIRTRKGEWAFTVPNAAHRAHARMIELHKDMAATNGKTIDQIKPEAVIRKFLNLTK